MLPKSRRIPRELFKELLTSRKYFNSPHFTLRVAPGDSAKVAVSVSKKVSKKATNRNRTRRRVYGFFDGVMSSLDKGLYLVSAKPGADKIKGESLKNELAELFKKG